MARRPNPLKATQREDIEAREALHARQFAQARIDYLVSKLGLQPERRRAYDLAQAETGEYLLTFDALLLAAPFLPVYLGFERLGALHTVPSAMLPALFNQFGRSPIAAAYRRFCEANVTAADGRLLGLVFPRNRIVQGMVIHNGDVDTFCAAGTSMVVNDPKLGRLVVQKFVEFVAALYTERHNWLNR